VSTGADTGERLLLRAEEAAAILGLSLRELYRVGTLPPGSPGALPAGVVVRIGRRVRFSRPRLEAWLGTNGEGGGGSR
jgi:predicted DNA-binding transcriptional regulator AlpA